MVENEKKQGFMDIIKGGLSHITNIISASISSPIEEATERVMDNIENRIIRVEKRIIKNVSSLLIILFGGTFLIFSLYFLLIDFFVWSNALAFFTIGITVFVIGLLLKMRNSNN